MTALISPGARYFCARNLFRPPNIAEQVKKGVDFFVGFENPVNELTGENVARLDIEDVRGSRCGPTEKRLG